MSRKKKSVGAPWWIALGTGMTLILIPEPATTATGLAIVAATVGYRAVK